MRHLGRNQLLARLEWLLDGLAGDATWCPTVADPLSPVFTERIPAETFVAWWRARSQMCSPVTVIGLGIGGHTARARLRLRDGSVYVAACVVGRDSPHRITSCWFTAFVPDHLTPRLPVDFASHELPSAIASAKLVVISGAPGTGRSTLTDVVGRGLDIPVCAEAWQLGALVPFSGHHHDDRLEIVEELLMALALLQLMRGQPAILDSPVKAPTTRARWRSLASRAGRAFTAIVCVCSDPAVHRDRVEHRRQRTPSWHDARNWASVERRTATFPPCDNGALAVDAANPLDANVARAIARIQS